MVAAAVLALAGCATTGPQVRPAATVAAPRPAPPPGLDPAADPDPFPSTYRAPAAAPFAIVDATILSATGPRIDGGTILVENGRIARIGQGGAVPAGWRIVDAHGRYVTPGIIDPHSHVGALSSPKDANGDDPNEFRNPAGTRVENSIWAQDPMFGRALAAGVTAMQILPGSGSTINGRSVVLKNVPAIDVKGMKFPNAPGGLKLACGENPARGGPGLPNSRAGLMREFRSALINAADYGQRWKRWRSNPAGDPPKRDLELENVSAMLSGALLVQIHCYRADEMLQMIDLAHEFGFRIAAFHHANEAFKIAPTLAREGIAVATWAGDWAGYKMEAYDSILENAAFVEAAGGLVAMHSDDVELMQHLNQEAGRAMAAGRNAGIPITEDQAIRWITINPARMIGIAAQTGSLEAGKMADLLVWDTDPFSVYALPDLVFIDGVERYDRHAPPALPRSDYELGNALRKEPPAYPVPSWDARR